MTAHEHDPTRRREVTWQNPLAAAARGAAMSGRQHLEAMLAGELPPPPISELLRFRLTRVDDGAVEFVCTPDESMYNPIGGVHGGVMCTLLDSVIGCAVQTTLPAGTGYTSVEIKISYLRPLRADSGELTAVGRVVKPGRRVAFGDGEVRDGEGRLVATGSGTCLLLPA
jgi:uncharacterized protein (TIGR00369 family)